MIMNNSVVSAVRNVIAKHLQIAPDRLAYEARFDDLGADWLDRLELLIVIDDQVAEFSFNNVVAEQIETVGDLMRLVTGTRNDEDRHPRREKGNRSASLWAAAPAVGRAVAALPRKQ
jgi:acyl carrier protein